MRYCAVVVLSALLTGCVNLAPRYERPALPVPANISGGIKGSVAAEVTVADVRLSHFVVEDRLRRLIDKALANNREIRVAALTAEEARTQFRLSRAERFPTVALSLSEQAQRMPAAFFPGQPPGVNRLFQGGVGVSNYELDLLGRLRNAAQASGQRYMASVEDSFAAQVSIVGEVINAWMALLADREALALAHQSEVALKGAWERVGARHAAGLASGLELSQAETAFQQAVAQSAQIQGRLANDRSALQLLTTEAVGEEDLPDQLEIEALRELSEDAQISSLQLLARPDVRSAEYALMAASADIGAARAAFFPQITLTGFKGSASNELSSLFDSGTRMWTFQPQISLPIFTAGRLKASLDAAKIRRDIAVAQYERSVQVAFQEVSDALAARTQAEQSMLAQNAIATAAERGMNLAMIRYEEGLDGYLDVVDAQQNFFNARQNAVQARFDLLAARVSLFKALGGGAY